jgi:hypothetical protein
MRRFTETNKWDDPWFRDLPGVHKLVFLYIIDRCNNAGFWEVDMAGMQFHTKLEDKHLQGALKGLARGIEGADGWVWVKNFLKHQKNDVLNELNPAHRQIISLIKDQILRFPKSNSSIPEGACKGLQSPIGIGIGKGIGKEPRARAVKSIGEIEEMKAFAVEIGLPETDGENCFYKWKSTGWKGIKDWRMKMRTWKMEGFHPSQKPSNGSPKTDSNGFTPLFPGHRPDK